MAQKPDPSRFLDFREFPDKKGFELPDGSQFFYDQFGGWFDEYKNYYNSEGKLSNPPKPEDLYEYNDYDLDDGYADDDLGYDDGYEDTHDQYDEFYHNFKYEQRTAKSEKHLESYPLGSEIIIEFSNMNFKAKIPDLSNFFLNDYPKPTQNLIRKIVIDYHEDNAFMKKGTGRIITNNKDFALFCIKKDGNDLLGRPLNLEISNFAGESDSEEEVKITKKPTNLENSPKKESFLPVKEPNSSWRNQVKIDSKEFKPTEKPLEIIENNEKTIENKEKTIENNEKTIEIQLPVSNDAWDKPLPKQVNLQPKKTTNSVQNDGKGMKKKI